MAKIKGICKNIDGCDLAVDKVVQEKEKTDFKCEECGHDLYPYDDGIGNGSNSTKNKKNILIIAAIALAAIAGGLLFFLQGSHNNKETDALPIDSVAPIDSVSIKSQLDTIRDTIVERDTIIKRDTVTVKVPTGAPEKNKPQTSAQPKKNEDVKPQVTSTKGSLNLSYGTYKGDIKGGYPEGMGRLTYNTTRQINRYDSKHRTANPGDYVIGEFVHGFFVQGKHYNSNGELIESLMVGVPANNAFESK